MNIENLKRITSEKKTRLTSLRKSRLGNSQGRNWKNKRIIYSYLNEQYHGIKQINQCSSEFSLCLNMYSPKENEQKDR